MADSSAAPAVPPPTRKYVLKERKISFGRDKPKKDAEEEAPAAASPHMPDEAADAAGPVMGAGVLGEDEGELKADAMLSDSEDEKDEDGPLAPAMAAAATAEEAGAPLLGSARASQRGLESFRGTVKKAETITPNGVIGRVVPADHRRKIILDVSADGITVHDLGEKAQERARTQTGTIRGMIVPMDFIAAWDPKVAERRIIIILSKDMSKFKRLVLHDIDAEGVAAALQQCAMMRAEVLAEEIAQLRQDQEDRAVRRSSSRFSTSRFSLSRARSILGGSSMLSSLDRATSKSEAFEGIDDITRAEAEAELGV